MSRIRSGIRLERERLSEAQTTEAMLEAAKRLNSLSLACFASTESCTELRDEIRDCIHGEWRRIYDALSPLSLMPASATPPEIREACGELLIAITEGKGPIPQDVGDWLDGTGSPLSELTICTALKHADERSTTAAQAVFHIALDPERQYSTRESAIRKLAAGGHTDLLRELKTRLEEGVGRRAVKDPRLDLYLRQLPSYVDQSIEEEARKKQVQKLPNEEGAQRHVQEYLLSSAEDGQRWMAPEMEQYLIELLRQADVQSTMTQRAAMLFAADPGRGRALREHALAKLASTGRVELLGELQAMIEKRQRGEAASTPTVFERSESDRQFDKEILGVIGGEIGKMRGTGGARNAASSGTSVSVTWSSSAAK